MFLVTRATSCRSSIPEVSTEPFGNLSLCSNSDKGGGNMWLPNLKRSPKGYVSGSLSNKLSRHCERTRFSKLGQTKCFEPEFHYSLRRCNFTAIELTTRAIFTSDSQTGRSERQICSQPGATSGTDAPVEMYASTFAETKSLAIRPQISFLQSERAKVVAMVALALALSNADRVVMSVAIVPLASQYNWSSSFLGVIQSSFLWGYLMSPIVAGALADQYGGKQVMAYGVALWSLATLLTPWAADHSLGMLLAMRTIMGLAEGVAMPCMNNLTSRWFPSSERATAVGLSMAGFHLGIVAGLLPTPFMIARFGSTGPFIPFGVMGFLWLLVWVCSISKNPESHTHISKSELLYIQKGNGSLAKFHVKPVEQINTNLPPFGLLLSKLPTWAIIIANATNNWGYFILLSWMPIYFNTVFGVNLKQAAWFSAFPWAIMAAVGFIAGTCSDRLIQSGLKLTTVRKIMQSVGFLGPAISLIALNAADNVNVATMWLTAALGFSAFSQAGFLVNHQEIGPRYAGVLHGMSNTAGTMAAIISTIGAGLFIQWLGSLKAFLNLTALLYILSAVFWNSFSTGERIFY